MKRCNSQGGWLALKTSSPWCKTSAKWPYMRHCLWYRHMECGAPVCAPVPGSKEVSSTLVLITRDMGSKQQA